MSARGHADGRVRGVKANVIYFGTRQFRGCERERESEIERASSRRPADSGGGDERTVLARRVKERPRRAG